LLLPTQSFLYHWRYITAASDSIITLPQSLMLLQQCQAHNHGILECTGWFKNRTKTGQDGARPALPKIFLSLYYAYCLFVNVWCTAATGCQPNVWCTAATRCQPNCGKINIYIS
jgi:hypothetical protein